MASTQIAGQGRKIKEFCPKCGKLDVMKVSLILDWNKGHKKRQYVKSCVECSND